MSLIVVGSILRFYNLTWGAPFYFHPDERNIASSVSQLLFPTNMHPHFFAYGSLPIYTIYFTGVFVNAISQLPNWPVNWSSLGHVSFETAIIISRFYSALFSILLIPLLCKIGEKLLNTSTGLVAAGLATFSVGLIQYAHFGTFELWLTFFTVLLFSISLRLLEDTSTKVFLYGGLVLGILVSIKISSIVLIPLYIFAFFVSENFSRRGKKWSQIAKTFGEFILKIFFVIVTTTVIFILSNPFSLLDFHSFQGTLEYESGVALGTMSVFYTGEFHTSIPVIFHFFHVYPFLLNPLVTILLLPSLLFLITLGIRKKQRAYLLLIIFSLLLFLSQAFLFVKWVRYVVPTLPFIYLMLAIAIHYFFHLLKKRIRYLVPVLTSFLFFISCLFALSYVVTVFVEEDTRIQALTFAKKYISSQETIASEVYDLGIVPFNETYPFITLVNIYDLDENKDPIFQKTEREKMLQKEIILLPSQRIVKTRLKDQETFPNGHQLYRQLFSGSLRYNKMYQTPCSIFCMITYLGDPVNNFEGTANVFDRPTVYIFEKS